MKNNTLAMLATIALVAAFASMIGYIDPATCTVENKDAFLTCEEAANQHIYAFWGFAGFSAVVLLSDLVRRVIKKRRKSA